MLVPRLSLATAQQWPRTSLNRLPSLRKVARCNGCRRISMETYIHKRRHFGCCCCTLFPVVVFRSLYRTYLTFCTMYASVALAYHQAVDDLHKFRTYPAPVSQKNFPVLDPRPSVFTITVNPLNSLPDTLPSFPALASRARPQVVEIDLDEESKQPQSCSAVLLSCVKHMFQSFFTRR